MPYIVKQSDLAGLGKSILVREVAAFKKAIAEHAQTVGVPAPTAHPVVEAIVKKYAGVFEVEDDTKPPPETAPDATARLATAEDRIATLEAAIEGLTKQPAELIAAVNAISRLNRPGA